MPTILIAKEHDQSVNQVPNIPGAVVLHHILEVAPHVNLETYSYGDVFWVAPVNPKHSRGPHWDKFRIKWALENHGNNPLKIQESDVPLIDARVLSEQAFSKNVDDPDWHHRNYWGTRPTGVAPQVVHSYPTPGSERHSRLGGMQHSISSQIPWNYLTIEIQVGDTKVSADIPFAFPRTGQTQIVDNRIVNTKVDFYGKSITWQDQFTGQYGKAGFQALQSHLAFTTDRQLQGALWTVFLTQNMPKEVDGRGIAGLEKQKKYAEALAELDTLSPVAMLFYAWLHDGKTQKKVSNNKLLAAMLRQVGPNAKNILIVLQRAMDFAHTVKGQSYSFDMLQDATRPICSSLPGATDMIHEAEAKVDWSIRKSAGSRADGLMITKEGHPKLRKAIEDGLIPTGVFANPDKAPVNREYDIWEQALKRKDWAPIISEVAKAASSRSTYNKFVTPWLAFMFKIEVYLKRHTKKSWHAMPKFVQSEWDLEMDDTNDSGTTNKRSAFTPVADNETMTITVPFVAVHVSGFRSQWCYSAHYYVYEKYMTDPISQGIVPNDLEVKLNGRDDYGLMFFTLDGTDTATGYPTFLIIFERLERGTRVHFHRVHPCRSKQGVQTQPPEHIQKCYQYMAGNIPASDIHAQQGDMIFIHLGDHNPVNAKAKVGEVQRVNEFESHRFVPPNGTPGVDMYPSEATTPKNRLGFIHAPDGFDIVHPEHDDVVGMPKGWYEVRRCRSWEANPKAIWSMTID